jgi:hypothetical protein
MFFDRDARHWLYPRTCDCCGTRRMEAAVRRLLRARSDAELCKALNALVRGPRRHREPSVEAIKRGAAKRIAAAAAKKAIVLDIEFVLSPGK